MSGSAYFVFFFKQKTAYEMRISDWSSDVCSSDLCRGPRSPPRSACSARGPRAAAASCRPPARFAAPPADPAPQRPDSVRQEEDDAEQHRADDQLPGMRQPLEGVGADQLVDHRSDEGCGDAARAGQDGDEDQFARHRPVHHRIRGSEEHTSELQSLMRNSYAVFCLEQTKHI